MRLRVVRDGKSEELEVAPDLSSVTVAGHSFPVTVVTSSALRVELEVGGERVVVENWPEHFPDPPAPVDVNGERGSVTVERLGGSGPTAATAPRSPPPETATSAPTDSLPGPGGGVPVTPPMPGQGDRGSGQGGRPRPHGRRAPGARGDEDAKRGDEPGCRGRAQPSRRSGRERSGPRAHAVHRARVGRPDYVSRLGASGACEAAEGPSGGASWASRSASSTGSSNGSSAEGSAPEGVMVTGAAASGAGVGSGVGRGGKKCHGSNGSLRYLREMVHCHQDRDREEGEPPPPPGAELRVGGEDQGNEGERGQHRGHGGEREAYDDARRAHPEPRCSRLAR